MKIRIINEYLKELKKIKDPRINRYLSKIENISEDEAIVFMEYLYDKSNEYLKGKNYTDTPESILLEKIADYIYDITK